MITNHGRNAGPPRCHWRPLTRSEVDRDLARAARSEVPLDTDDDPDELSVQWRFGGRLWRLSEEVFRSLVRRPVYVLFWDSTIVAKGASAVEPELYVPDVLEDGRWVMWHERIPADPSAAAAAFALHLQRVTVPKSTHSETRVYLDWHRQSGRPSTHRPIYAFVKPLGPVCHGAQRKRPRDDDDDDDDDA